MSTRFGAGPLAITDADQTFSLDPFVNLSILNIGNNDCQFQFDGPVTANSPWLYQSNSYTFGADGFTTFHVKCAAGKTTTVQGVLTKQFNV